MLKTLGVVLIPLLLLGAVGAAPLKVGPALERQRAVVAANPDDAGAHNDLGNLLLLAGNEAEAEAAYRKAVELAPKAPTGHYNLGLLLQRKGKTVAAFKEFRKVVDLDPRHAWGHYQIGTAYLRWGVESLALRAFTRALAIEPRLADAAFNPQILDNPLATQAMLRAHREAPQAVPAQVAYQDPSAIAKLLLEGDRPSAEPAPKSSAPQAASPVSTPAAGGTTRAVPAAAPAVDAKGEEPTDEATWEVKVIDTSALEPGKATGQLQGGTQPPPRRGRRGFENQLGPSQTISPGDTGTSGEGGYQPPPVFVPAPVSTGRLELVVHPHPTQQPS